MAARQACDRTEIDDRAAAAPDHFGNRVFRHQHDRGDIDAHRAVPCLYVDLDGIAARPGDADIVDEDVEPAPGLRCARDNRLTRCGNADVTTMICATPPSASIRRLVSSAHCAVVSTSITCAPCRARMTDVARPLPIPSAREPAPVTMATLPLRRSSLRIALMMAVGFVRMS